MNSSDSNFSWYLAGGTILTSLIGYKLGWSVSSIASATFIIMLLFSVVYFVFVGDSIRKNLDRQKAGRRPTRSRDNELGSSDLANSDHLTQWLQREGPLDTMVPVTNLRGSEGIYLRKGHLVIPNGERNRHILIIAKTGSGKTTRLILPILYSDCLSKERSTVVIDSKPEMWDKLAGMTSKYNPEKRILLFNPLDTVRSLAWNILAKVENDTDAKLIANTIIQATEGPNTKADSPFFKNNALQLLNAIMVGLLEDPSERLSMPRVHQLVHSGKENLCTWLEAHPGAIRSTRTFVELARSGSQNADTVLSELGMRLSAWDLRAIRATTYAEELDLDTLINEPTILIVEFRESEIEMLRPMANVIVVELLRYLTKRAEGCPGCCLPRPVSLVIDEFASALGRLPDIHVKLNTLRSRNVSIVAAIQSIGQIKANYEKDGDSVLSGFSTKILMPAIDFMDAEWASKETGTMTIRYKTKSTGSNKRLPDAFAHYNKGLQEQVQQRAVLTPDEIGRPPDNIATFFMPNTPVFQGFLTPYYKDKEMASRIGSGDNSFSPRTEPLDYRDPTSPRGKPMTERELRATLEQIKIRLEWEQTEGVAREWWEAFESQNKDQLPTVLTLCEELEKRNCSITEFFMAFVNSKSDSIPGILQFIDAERAAAEERAKAVPEPDSEPQTEPESVSVVDEGPPSTPTRVSNPYSVSYGNNSSGPQPGGSLHPMGNYAPVGANVSRPSSPSVRNASTVTTSLYQTYGKPSDYYGGDSEQVRSDDSVYNASNTANNGYTSLGAEDASYRVDEPPGNGGYAHQREEEPEHFEEWGDELVESGYEDSQLGAARGQLSDEEYGEQRPKANRAANAARRGQFEYYVDLAQTLLASGKVHDYRALLAMAEDDQLLQPEDLDYLSSMENQD